MVLVDLAAVRPPSVPSPTSTPKLLLLEDSPCIAHARTVDGGATTAAAGSGAVGGESDWMPDIGGDDWNAGGGEGLQPRPGEHSEPDPGSAKGGSCGNGGFGRGKSAGEASRGLEVI